MEGVGFTMANVMKSSVPNTAMPMYMTSLFASASSSFRFSSCSGVNEGLPAVATIPAFNVLAVCDGKMLSINFSIWSGVSTYSSPLTSREFYLATGNADVQKIGVHGVVSLVYLSRILLENLADGVEILRALRHELARIALGDLDISLEEVLILEAQLECCDGHALGNCAKVEHALVSDSSEVEKTVIGTSQCEIHHF